MSDSEESIEFARIKQSKADYEAQNFKSVFFAGIGAAAAVVAAAAVAFYTLLFYQSRIKEREFEDKIAMLTEQLNILSMSPGKYKTDGWLTNASGVDRVEAKCQEPDEWAISGLCVINGEEGWGWLLQNAGVTGAQTWGCVYRRSAYVEGGQPNDRQPHGKFNLRDASLPYDVRGAAVTAKATATVVCQKKPS